MILRIRQLFTIVEQINTCFAFLQSIFQIYFPSLSTFRNDNGISHGGQRSTPIGSPKGATDSFPAWVKPESF